MSSADLDTLVYSLDLIGRYEMAALDDVCIGLGAAGGQVQLEDVQRMRLPELLAALLLPELAGGAWSQRLSQLRCRIWRVMRVRDLSNWDLRLQRGPQRVLAAVQAQLQRDMQVGRVEIVTFSY